VKIAIGIGGAAATGDDWKDLVTYVEEAEKLGVDSVWSAEAWGTDGVAPLAFLAARTERIFLGTGILQISARVPAMTAMTALTLAQISGDRFRLGLGASGPQVVEGLQGLPFAAPLTRMRETVDIVRLAFRGEKLVYSGRQHTLPRPGGEGKPLRLALAANPHIPIYLATLTPRALELTGEIADGWLGTSFVPEAAAAHFDAIARGAARAGKNLSDLDLAAGGHVAFGEPQSLIDARKPSLAFTLGAMGSATTNFYNDAWCRAGYEHDAKAVQQLWLAKRREDAAARVPDEMVVRSNLLGTEDMVRDRIRAYRTAGVTTLRVDPEGSTPGERLDTLARFLDLVSAEGD